MNSFLFTAITLCLAGQCALAHYQSSGYGGQQQHGGHYMQQRKLAPTPQTYGSSNGYHHQQQQHLEAGPAYGGHQEQHYEAPAAYRAPSSASVSQYDERVPAASHSGYGAKPAAAPVAAYGRQQSAGYSAPAAYAKPAAPKYEEPYHPPMPFAWGYDINDGYGGAQYHKENGDEYGKRTGSYGYTDAYGIYRQVDYVADEHGFRATIKTNEPGTANESPADVELHAYEPPSNYYAGNRESSYGGKQSSAYSAPAPAPAQQQQQQQYGSSSYSAPAPARQSSYGRQSSSSYKQSAPRYEQAAQYSSSSLVPVYQKAAVAPKAAVAAKHY